MPWEAEAGGSLSSRPARSMERVLGPSRLHRETVLKDKPINEQEQIWKIIDDIRRESNR